MEGFLPARAKKGFPLSEHGRSSVAARKNK